MKNAVKKILLTLGVIACTLPTLRAEDTAPAGPSPERREERRERFKEGGKRMAKELGLTEDQQAKMKGLMEEQKAAADAIKADTSLSEEQRKEKMKNLMEEYKGKRQALMTPEQRKKAEEMRSKFQEHRPHHGDRPDAAK